ncbi:acyl-CoA N-acyltransferase [Myriangium duriaei CBS 260.36]|uniref:Acyl-CoA N-acyltransferase n=1 Tax=Myriangium duriaei CBS 260.36 TaxID=1168546 RepID=A0A9P4J2H3_9PEZI|nr:acyl-CoA N-acyltransferase [Myriangium duriaei CBS 260.36]
MLGTRSHSHKVRKAVVEDAEQVATLGVHVFTTSFGHTVTKEQLKSFLDEAYSTAAIKNDITNPDKDMLVAEDDNGTIVGFVLMNRASIEPCVEHLKPKIELQRLYISIDHHGQGIAQALTREVEDSARKNDFKYMWLGVWENNHRAQKVYKKLGYQRIGEHVFDIGGDLQTDHIMWKTL